MSALAAFQIFILINFYQDFLLINGDEVEEISDYPYVASIRTYPGNTHVCAGAIIASNWILTAASCFGNNTDQSEDKIVFAGHLDSNGKVGPISHVEAVVLHPTFHQNFHSIALLKLDKALFWFWQPWVRATKIRSIKVGPIGVGAEVVLVGWNMNGTDVETEMNFHFLRTKDTEEGGCTNDVYSVCAGSKIPDDCYGNGSPVVDKSGKIDKLVAVASSNNEVGNCQSSYVRIEPYILWIKDQSGVNVH